MRNNELLIFGWKPIQSSLCLCRSSCALLTFTSKSHSINSFSLSVIRMLLFIENSFTASTFSSKINLRIWEFPFAKSFTESYLPGRRCWSYQTTFLTWILLKKTLLLSILQWFNLIIHSLNTHRGNDFNTVCSNWEIWIKTWFSVITVSICLLSKK